tara:strand:- start:223 stop:450 length:228 start_codon:yes stop_codon:yes gene_type:complete
MQAFKTNQKIWYTFGGLFVTLMIGKQVIWSVISEEVTSRRVLQHQRALMELELSEIKKINHKYSKELEQLKKLTK